MPEQEKGSAAIRCTAKEAQVLEVFLARMRQALGDPAVKRLVATLDLSSGGVCRSEIALVIEGSYRANYKFVDTGAA